MKIKLISVSMIIVLLLVVVLLNSCDLFGVTKDQRITSFVEDLNQNPRPNSIQSNFSSSGTIYNTLNGAFFDIDFPTSSIPYAVSNLDLDSDPVTGTISGTGDPAFGGSCAIEFTMVKEKSDWLILELWVEFAGIVVY